MRAWEWECGSRPASPKGLGRNDECLVPARGQGLGLNVRAQPGGGGGVRDGVMGARGPH